MYDMIYMIWYVFSCHRNHLKLSPLWSFQFFTTYTWYRNCWTFWVYAASALPMGVHPLQPPFHFSLMVNIGSLVAGNLSMIFLMWMMIIAASVTAAYGDDKTSREVLKGWSMGLLLGLKWILERCALRRQPFQSLPSGEHRLIWCWGMW